MRAVLDPNVIISGVLSAGGAPARVLRACQEGHFELVTSPLVLDELRRALGYPKLRKRVSEEDGVAVLEWLGSESTLVPDPAMPPPIRSQDPGDDYLIALAAQQRTALVSGDHHLLELAPRMPVYSPRGFLEVLEARKA